MTGMAWYSNMDDSTTLRAPTTQALLHITSECLGLTVLLALQAVNPGALVTVSVKGTTGINH